MARVVEFEGRRIEVPDDASDAEVAEILGSSAPTPKPSQPSVAGDVVKSFATGAALRQPASVIGAPRDVAGLITGPMMDGVLSVGNQVRSLLGLEPTVPTAEQREGMRSMGRAMTPNLGLGGSADVQKTVENNITGEWHKPQTTAGKYAQTVGEFALPGGLPSKAVRNAPTAALKAGGYVSDLLGGVVAPAMLSEGGGQLAEGTALEIPARIAGAVAGNAGYAIGRAMNSPDMAARRATAGTTPEQWDAAIAAQRGNRTGIDVTGPEYLSQATGGASPITDLLRVVEGSVDGRARTGPFFAQRPGQVDDAVGQWLDSIAPQSKTPSVLGPRASDAATRGIKAVEEQRTNAVDPLYRMADANRVTPDVVDGLINRIDQTMAADSTGILHGPLGELRTRLIEKPATAGTPASRTPVTGPNGQVIRYESTPAVDPTPHTPITDVENLDRVRKYFRDKMDMLQTGQDAITKEQGAAIAAITTQLDAAMEAASPAFSAAKNAYGKMTRDVVQPIAEGPLGRVAAATDTPAAGAAILPQNPMVGSGPETADAVSRLMAQDSDTTAALVRQTLGDRYSRASTETMGGNREFGGAKFHKDVAGNAAKQEVLDAVLGGVPGPTAGPSANELLNILQTTGRRRQLGSMTEPNRQITDTLSAANPLQAGAGAAMTGGATFVMNARDALRRNALRGNIESLAEMFMDPNSVQLMRNAANRGLQINTPEALARTGGQLAPLFLR